MNTFTIEGRTLNAINTHAAKKDIRYYLNGLHIKSDDNGLVIEATDGHRLAQYRPDVENTLDHFDVIVTPPKLPASKTVEVSVSESSVSFQTSDAVYNGTMIYGRYPDTEQVIPSEVSNDVSTLNPNYVADAGKLFGEVAKAKGIRNPMMRVYTNGESMTLFNSPKITGLLVVLMPMRE